MSRPFVFLLLGLGLLAAIGAVTYTLVPKATPSDKSSVAVTIFPIYDIARNIAGEDVDVVLVLPPGASPHTFEPSPETLRVLTRADLLFTVGYGIDDWAVNLAAETGVRPVQVDRDITLRASVEEEHEEEDEEEEEHGPIDPHYWLTVPNAMKIAETIEAELAATYPEHAQAFASRLSSYLQELAELDASARATLSEIENRNIITFHDAWYYFAEGYGLKIVGTYEPSAGREPTPRELARLSELLEEAGTSTIYSEPQSSSSGIEAFASDTGLTIAELDDIGGIPGRASYIELMQYNVDTIAENQD